MRKKSKTIVSIIIILLIFVATATMTLGKYAYNSVWNYYLSSKGFYFESDLLNINTKKNSLLKWDGSNVSFVIKNSLNTELISEYDISYKVTCEVLGDEASYIDCSINDSSSSFNGSLASIAKCVNNIDDTDVSAFDKTTCNLSGYLWSDEITSKENYFNLVLKDNTKSIDEVSVKITAESLTPYHKTLTGIFNLNKIEQNEEEIITYYENYSEYDELSIVNNSNVDKCLNISFNTDYYTYDNEGNAEYTYDSTNKIGKLEVTISKKNSTIHNFYKLNELKEYSVNDFVIEEKEC